MLVKYSKLSDYKIKKLSSLSLSRKLRFTKLERAECKIVLFSVLYFAKHFALIWGKRGTGTAFLFPKFIYILLVAKI